MSDPYAARCGACVEGEAASGLTRRTLLRGALATGAALTIGPNLGVRFAAAATPSGSDTLVVLFLRGGFHALMQDRVRWIGAAERHVEDLHRHAGLLDDP